MSTLAMPALHSMGQKLDRINGYIACLLAFVIPISAAGINICFYTMLALFLLSGQWAQKWHLIKTSRLAQAALLLWLLTFISVLYSEAGLHFAMQMATKYNKLLLIPIVIYTLQEPKQVRRCLSSFFAAMIFTLILGYCKFYGFLPPVLGGYHFYWSPATPFIHHIQTNMLMALTAFWLVYISFRPGTPTKLRIFYSALMLVTIHYVLFMNIARSGYWVLGALTPVLGYIFLRKKQWKRAIAVVLLLSLSFIAAAHFSPVFQERINQADSNVQQYQNNSDTSIGKRIDFYRHTLTIIAEHPIIGTGIGGFKIAYQQLTTRLNLTDPTSNPHNQYLDTTAQLGVIGLALLIWLYASAWFCRNRQNESLAVLAQGIAITLMTGSLFNSWLMDINAGFIFCLLAALTTQSTTEDCNRP